MRSRRKTSNASRRILALSAALIIAGMAVCNGADAAAGDCTQPVSSGSKPIASDCLFILRSAVGTLSCQPCICDSNGAGTVLASDSLLCLRIAVGQSIPLACPECQTTTTSTLPPPTTTSTTTTTLGVVATCSQETFQCGDLIDNDGDDLVDAEDPSCLGACDNSENGYATNIPGHLLTCKQDCYWDRDTGSGNDTCFWSHKCDPHEVEPTFDPQGDACAFNAQGAIPGTSASCADLANAQTGTCTTVCGSATPNGCDCFGCCELPAGSGNHVWLSSTNGSGTSTCGESTEDDPTKCRPCQPVLSCNNPCGDCEICIGKPELEPGCEGGQVCPQSAQPCGLEGQPRCPEGEYCTTGCCRPTFE